MAVGMDIARFRLAEYRWRPGRTVAPERPLFGSVRFVDWVHGHLRHGQRAVFDS